MFASRFLYLFKVLSIICLLLMCLILYSSHHEPQMLGKFLGIILFYPPLVIVNFLFFLVWLISKKYWMVLLHLAIFFINYNCITANFGFGFNKDTSSETAINVCTFNCRDFDINLYNFRKKLNTAQKAWELIVKESGSPEVILFQEYNQNMDTFFTNHLKYKHYHVIAPLDGNTAIFSKFPILKTGDIPFQESGNSCTWADIRVKNNIIRFYSMHLQSSSISADAKYFSSNTNFNKKSTWSMVLKIYKKYYLASYKRFEQLQIVKDHIKTSPYPIIVGTDLNDVPASSIYYHFQRDLIDAFTEKGRGFGITYHGRIPWLKIDYIFADKRLSVLSYDVVHNPGISDHLPVFSTIEIR